MPRKNSLLLNTSHNLLTIQEASYFLHCHPNTLRKWDKKGILQAIHVGKRGDRRYKKEDLLSLMNEESIKPSVDDTSHHIIEQMAEAFVSWDNDWRYMVVNENAARFLHKSKEEMIGKKLLDIFPDIEKSEFFQKLLEVTKKGKPCQYTYFSPSSKAWVESYLYPTPQGLSMYFTNIDEKKRYEKMNEFLLKANRILSSSLSYKDTIKNLAQLVVPAMADWFTIEIINRKGELHDVTIIHENPTKVRLAKRLRKMYGDTQQGRAFAQHVLKTGKAVFYPYITSEDIQKSAENQTHLRLMQSLHFHSVIVVPLKVEGKVIGVADFILSETNRHYDKFDSNFAEEIGRIAAMAISHARLYDNLRKELYHRKLVEKSLRESESKLNAFLAHSNDSVMVLGEHAEILYRSPFATNVSGYSNDEIFKVGIFHNMHPDDREKVQRAFYELTKCPQKTDMIEYRVKHKNGRWVWIEATATNWLHEPSVAGVVVNFRNITDRKTIETRLRLQAQIMQHANDAILVFDGRDKILYWNPEAEKMYGWTKKEAVGKTASKLLHTSYPIPFGDIIKILNEKGVWNGELKHTLKDGKEIVVDSSWAMVQREGRSYILEINRDITEKKEMEYRKDEFISIASHELKTPLTSLKIFIQYLQKYTENTKDKTLQQYLGKIVQQTDSLATLVSDLLDISKIQSGKLPFERRIIDLNESIEDIVEVDNSLSSHKITVSGKLPPVYGDLGRLIQVVDNFVSNAIKYSPKGSPIEIILSYDNTNAKVCVRDYGIGIDKKYQQKIFERFFRAGEVSEHTYPGLGIGLYICAQIIERHGGKIWVESEKGNGSTFCFTIPLA